MGNVTKHTCSAGVSNRVSLTGMLPEKPNEAIEVGADLPELRGYTTQINN